MSSSDAPADLMREPGSAGGSADGSAGRGAVQALFAALLGLLVATGWVANHFVALMPVISDRQHLSEATLDAIFGIYAVGLLPGLLIGGRTSDALGRQSVALAGSATALAGTVAMLVSQQYDVLLWGRLIVGLGVGLSISSCTAWASDLKGPSGAATAGAVLMGGFAIGPLAGAVISQAGPAGVRVSFAVAAVVVVAAMVAAWVVAVVAGRGTEGAVSAPSRGPAGPAPARQGTGWALSWALPLAPWVFASATLGFVTVPTRIHTALAAPMAAGMATLIVNGTSGLIQILARARRWGPQAGTAGALLAALGYALTAAAPSTMTLAWGLPLFLLLGCASGLCLRAGLIDLETTAPQRVRGGLIGAFYVVTYIGFGLPLLLTTLGSGPASAMVLGAMAALAALTAAGRAVRLRRS